MPIGCQLKHVIWFLVEGETNMADKGRRDKGGKDQRKKPKLTPKERRKQKQDKKNKTNISSIP
jgi:hypothetical protein